MRRLARPYALIRVGWSECGPARCAVLPEAGWLELSIKRGDMNELEYEMPLPPLLTSHLLYRSQSSL